jgi:GTP cyclohydrolase I
VRLRTGAASARWSRDRYRSSPCAEHHSLPFFGKAYIGYIAHERILGLSKLTRQVRLLARRFSVQERIGQQLADGPERILAPHSVAVHWEAEHLCTQMPGVMELESSARTTFWRADQAELGDLRGANSALVVPTASP